MKNAAWITFTLVCFFMAATSYIIPYNALLPEMADTAAEKVKRSSFQQVGFVNGLIIAAVVTQLADKRQRYRRSSAGRAFTINGPRSRRRLRATV